MVFCCREPTSETGGCGVFKVWDFFRQGVSRGCLKRSKRGLLAVSLGIRPKWTSEERPCAAPAVGIGAEMPKLGCLVTHVTVAAVSRAGFYTALKFQADVASGHALGIFKR